jgi:hypothetical protein
MYKKYGFLMLIGFFAVAMTASYLMAQNQDSAQPRRIPTMVMPSRSIRVRLELPSLLNNETVQKELDLTGDQKTKVNEAIKASAADMEKGLSSLPSQPLNSQEMKGIMGKLVQDNKDKFMKQLNEILLPNQLDRLKELRIQAQGPQALLNTDVIQALKITDEQQKEMKAMNAEYQDKTKNVSGFTMRNMSPEEHQAKMTDMKEKMQKASKIFGDFLLGVLTQDQREQFEKMQGTKLDMDLSTSGITAGIGQSGQNIGGGPSGGGGN